MKEQCPPYEFVLDVVEEIDPLVMAVGRNADGTPRLERCPKGECEHRSMYDAYLAIGGRTSEAR